MMMINSSCSAHLQWLQHCCMRFTHKKGDDGDSDDGEHNGDDNDDTTTSSEPRHRLFMKLT